MANKRLSFSAILVAFSIMLAPSAMAAAGVLFDVEARRAVIAKSPAIQAVCLAKKMPGATKTSPIAGLKGTDGYGSDNRAAPFAWAVMLHTGRALAGDEKSEQLLMQLLKQWAKADAFAKNDEEHDTYYAMKRVMLPVVIGYDVVSDAMDQPTRALVSGWIDRNVRKLDKKFGGIVDVNNHRYLADSVLMAWGVVSGDKTLYEQGVERFKVALAELNADDSLPLEVRRGARAGWYTRHALTSLTVIAEIAKRKGADLYGLQVEGKTLDDLMASFLNIVNNPLTVLPAAAENYIPGPESDYMQQDSGMLKRRGKHRHYMAFAESWLRRAPKQENTLTLARLRALMAEEGIAGARPLMDDYVGGNASCFWWLPEEVK